MESRIYWFGEPWPSRETRAEICASEDQRVLTPQNRDCMFCQEPIIDGENGVMLPAVLRVNETTFEAAFEAAHIECFIRMTVGSMRHLERRCQCYGGEDERPEGQSARDEAREVFAFIVEQSLE